MDNDAPNTDAPSEAGPDPDTPSMFDEAEAGAARGAGTGAGADGGYQVLARKYRPRRFEDLIGQDAMVRTLTNAFEADRIAHAFMLTGVRGVGKTTTARLLARALNYARDGKARPSIRLDPPGDHCAAIMRSQHPDVLELDAASRTGVADMRDLLDGTRYTPVSARYKVYIIDEVHMLSTAAFNALLKTLEEPPPHVKFIFATTEIRKVPVTVLSRCQRFDLKRLDTPALARHLGRVADREGAHVEADALALIARAAEGSVRDGLSILDQALVQSVGGEAVTGLQMREMLGLGDRLRLYDLLERALSGDGRGAVAELAEQFDAGADPLVVLKDLIDIAADLATAQAVGADYDTGGPRDWTERTLALAEKVTPAAAARDWQILLSGYRDAQTAPDAAVAARMVILRLVAAANLPSPEEAARRLAEASTAREPGTTESGRTDPGGTNPGAGGDSGSGAPGGDAGSFGFEDVLDLLSSHREAMLLGDVETYLKPADVRRGTVVCAVKEGAPPDLLRRLADTLERITDEVWTVSRVEEGAETFKEKRARLRAEKIAAVQGHPAVQAVLAAIPGTEIVDVRQDARLEGTSGDTNVIAMPQRRQNRA